MRKFTSHSLLIAALFVFTAALKAQETDPIKEKIITAADNYFALNRENIHLHFDKTIFLNDEQIWFKGYVFDRKNNLPFYTTTNVFATLYDENGNKLKEQLLYANTGSFSGSFKLDKMVSGNYYIRVYTYWMNNFIEDESATYKIRVIDNTEPRSVQFTKPDYSNVVVEFQPEGGNLIKGTNNVVGIQLKGCAGNEIPMAEGEILNAKGEVIQKIFTNKFGFGRFEILPTDETYKAVLTINNKKIETILPAAVSNGIALEVNNYAIAGKFVVKLRTNSSFVTQLTEKQLYIIIQQDEKLSIVNADFKNGNKEQQFVLSNEYLYDGINIIRIIDADYRQLAERLIAKFPDSILESDVSFIDKHDGTISISGKLNHGNANISISILPENSLRLDVNDIFADFFINPYLTVPILNASYYFVAPSKAKKYELDLLLLNQKSAKYNWKNILSDPPKNEYPFENGLSIQGSVNQPLKDRSKFTIRLDSWASHVRVFSEIDENNDFHFNNIIAADSSKVSISLLKPPTFEESELKYTAKITNGKRQFNKIFAPIKCVCEIPATDLTEDYSFPERQKKMIYLNEVAVKQKPTNGLTRQNILGNSNLRGYKVKDTDVMPLLTYIGNNGFDVFNRNGDVAIYSRGGSTTINGSRTRPIIYLDDVQVRSDDMLDNIVMNDLDEIYLSAQAIVASMNNFHGMIKIYRKKPVYVAPKLASLPYTLNGGFSRINTFENVTYNNTKGQGFTNFGVIDWEPYIITEESGIFKCYFPHKNQKEIRLLIEGFTIDGKLISEIKTFKIN
ncbi:MAG: hypothetical protein PSV16_14115 [Flavobacterium sp.]|nr:hypothetical protein [Flavobacterium sp.]